MIKYSGYLINTEPDYKEMIKNGEEITDLWCSVYDENDEQMEHCLGEFNMMLGYEFSESTAESIEQGLYQIINDDYPAFELERRNKELMRTQELLDRAINFMKTTFGEEDLAGILEKELGMTKDEIEIAFAAQEQSEEIKML